MGCIDSQEPPFTRVNLFELQYQSEKMRKKITVDDKWSSFVQRRGEKRREIRKTRCSKSLGQWGANDRNVVEKVVPGRNESGTMESARNFPTKAIFETSRQYGWNTPAYARKTYRSSSFPVSWGQMLNVQEPEIKDCGLQAWKANDHCLAHEHRKEYWHTGRYWTNVKNRSASYSSGASNCIGEYQTPNQKILVIDHLSSASMESESSEYGVDSTDLDYGTVPSGRVSDFDSTTDTDHHVQSPKWRKMPEAVFLDTYRSISTDERTKYGDKIKGPTEENHASRVKDTAAARCSPRGTFKLNARRLKTCTL